MEPDAEDAEALALLREVAGLLEAAPPPALAGERGRQALATLQELTPMLPELAPGLGATGMPWHSPPAVSDAAVFDHRTPYRKFVQLALW